MEQILKSRGLWVTKNRLAIMACLSDQEHFHSINQIVNHTKKLINTKSIYNNIRALTKAGIVDSYTFDGISKYALNDQLLGQVHAVHLVRSNQKVDHLSVDQKVFAAISDQVQKVTGQKVRAVKIFVDLD